MKVFVQKLWDECAVKQRIFIGVFLTMFLAVLSIHFLVGRRAFNPLFKEVIERRAETVALIATSLEASPKPKRKLKELSKKLGVELKIVPEQAFWGRYKDRALTNRKGNKKGQQVTKGGYEITTFKRPKSPLFTTIDLRGEAMVLVVKFPVDIDQIKRRRGSDFAIIIAVLMVFSAIISHWAFKPIQRATLAMGQIADGNLDHRVTDNIGPAKEAFNQMADRVEQMLDGQRMLLAGVSHELRTPLARMRLQTALLDDKVDTVNLHEEITEMDALVEILLVSSQLRSGVFEIHAETINVQDLVLEVLAEIRLEERYVSLNIDPIVSIQADALLIRRVIWNILSNIVKYTPNDCTVSVEASTTDEGTQIEISDTGPGVETAQLSYMLEPFWRVDQSHSKKETSKQNKVRGGWGVGLSFVQQAMMTHSASVKLSHNHPSGLVVQLLFPKTENLG